MAFLAGSTSGRPLTTYSQGFPCWLCAGLTRSGHPRSFEKSGSGTVPEDGALMEGKYSGGASPPWELMGRVVTEDSVALRVEQIRKLVISAAARKSSLTEKDFEGRLEVFLTVLPDLGSRVDRLQPDLLFQLIDDLDGVIARILGLRELFPSANISLMVARSPSILLPVHYNHLPCSIDALKQCLPEGCSLDPIVEEVPFTLMCDMKRVMEELSRCMPTTDVAALIANQPDIIFSVQRVWFGVLTWLLAIGVAMLAQRGEIVYRFYGPPQWMGWPVPLISPLVNLGDWHPERICVLAVHVEGRGIHLSRVVGVSISYGVVLKAGKAKLLASSIQVLFSGSAMSVAKKEFVVPTIAHPLSRIAFALFLPLNEYGMQ